MNLICSILGKREILEKNSWKTQRAFGLNRFFSISHHLAAIRNTPGISFFLSRQPSHYTYRIISIQSVQKEMAIVTSGRTPVLVCHAHPYAFPSNEQPKMYTPNRQKLHLVRINRWRFSYRQTTVAHYGSNAELDRNNLFVTVDRSRRFRSAFSTEIVFKTTRVAFRGFRDNILRLAKSFGPNNTPPALRNILPALRNIPPPSIAFRYSRKKPTRTNYIRLKSTNKIAYVFPFVHTEITVMSEYKSCQGVYDSRKRRSWSVSDED